MSKLDKFKELILAYLVDELNNKGLCKSNHWFAFLRWLKKK